MLATEPTPSFRGVESRSGWPLTPTTTTTSPYGRRRSAPRRARACRRSRVIRLPRRCPHRRSRPCPPPPWLAGDMPTEPPALRLVDSPRPTRSSSRPARETTHDFRGGDPLTDPLPRDASGYDPFEGLRFEPPVLRVIDGEGSGRSRRTGGDESSSASSDGDLLIFSETRSAWFTEVDEYSFADDDTATWGHALRRGLAGRGTARAAGCGRRDDGWSAAACAAGEPRPGRAPADAATAAASSATRRASRPTRPATSGAGAAARRSAGSPSASGTGRPGSSIGSSGLARQPTTHPTRRPGCV